MLMLHDTNVQTLTYAEVAHGKTKHVSKNANNTVRVCVILRTRYCERSRTGDIKDYV
jgi:hypothetical protein